MEANSYVDPLGNALIAQRVWASEMIDVLAATIPKPDPGEKFRDIREQLSCSGDVGAADPPSMKGFVQNYMLQPAKDGIHVPAEVMHYFTGKQLPVLANLANSFGVSDQWYASAPCQTWPNRFFAHTGTSLGHVDNATFHVPFQAPSIFARLSQCERSWRVYFHDVPQSIMLGDVWYRALFHYRFFGQFLADANAGELPNYSFIEPRYFPDFEVGIPNDQHPPHNVCPGEKLISEVYNALRRSPCWKKCLLIVTYDEHGGCYDHRPPPTAIPPDANNDPISHFAFNRYGVRVPAVIVSPFVPAGSVIRARGGAAADGGEGYPFDHTSIIATLRKLFNLGEKLTDRDGAAPDLLDSLSLESPLNDGPAQIDVSVPIIVHANLSESCIATPNGHQDVLSRMSQYLPSGPLACGERPPDPQPLSNAGYDKSVAAGLDASRRVKSFLGV
jgi:phospholipase C